MINIAATFKSEQTFTEYKSWDEMEKMHFSYPVMLHLHRHRKIPYAELFINNRNLSHKILEDGESKIKALKIWCSVGVHYRLHF